MIKNLFYFVLVGFLVLAFSKCNGGNDENINIDSLINDDVTAIPEGEIDKIIQSLPSPVEMAALINDVGIPFSKSYLASPEKADDYDTNFKKALGLGVLSADLGYLNVYAQTNEIINYLATIRNISDDLNIGQFFDFQTLKRLATNNENMDSLMFLSVNSFHQMDDHLRKNNRSNLSALVVTGVWIEGLYLVTQIVKNGSDSKELKERIGEQKVIVEMLNQILQVYKVQDKNFELLAADFEKLKMAYEPVDITVETGEVTTQEIDGIIVVIPKDKTVVTMSVNQLNTIVSLTESIRNKLISL
ncbi:MAG: hypothetical protein P1P88_00335 [Bacteroidales bacterium]|nr:hypothetical protein [Bacteroidales bacterium]